MPSTPTQVRIQAPCRIHLGLLSVQAFQGRRFGGAGVMLDKPSLELSAHQSDKDQVTGDFADRSSQFLESWREYTGIREPVRLTVHRAPDEHVGLGLGTQLGMAVGAALDALFGRSQVAIETRAESVGRGLRSAVGAHGFHHGGLIVDGGKGDGELLGKLEAHVDLPPDWHVLLVRPQDDQGLAGPDEIQAFRELSRHTTQDRSEQLRATLFEELLPAAQRGDFTNFGQAVFRYGLQAGGMFAELQGGPFLNPTVAGLVEQCRSRGVAGVGQSSWGPTVFCWFESRQAAEAFAADLLTSFTPNLAAEITVSAVSRGGAEVTLS